jgi:UbiD family decarboxylase
VTLPLVYTEHPDGKGHNLGMYRMQIYDGQTTGMHWQIGKVEDSTISWQSRVGSRCRCRSFVGGPPALILSAIAPLPENVPELMLASLIAGERLPLSTAPGRHPHPLVANAEFALMGEVAPHERRPEGPFGDHYGYYSLQHDYPVFRVRQVARRKDAIYPATVVGKPRQEDFSSAICCRSSFRRCFPW